MQILIKTSQSRTRKSSQTWSVRPIQATADCKSCFLASCQSYSQVNFLYRHILNAHWGKTGKSAKVAEKHLMWRRQVIIAVNWVRPQRFTVEMNLVGVLKAEKSLNKVWIILIYWFGVPNWVSSVATWVSRSGAKPPMMTFLSSPVREHSSSDIFPSLGCCPIDEAAAWSAHGRTNGWVRERHTNVTQVSKLTHRVRCCASWHVNAQQSVQWSHEQEQFKNLSLMLKCYCLTQRRIQLHLDTKWDYLLWQEYN